MPKDQDPKTDLRIALERIDRAEITEVEEWDRYDVAILEMSAISSTVKDVPKWFWDRLANREETQSRIVDAFVEQIEASITARVLAAIVATEIKKERPSGK